MASRDDMNNPEEHSSQHSSDELSCSGGAGDGRVGSSSCDSDADISSSSETEMSCCQQANFKSPPLLQHDDGKSDKSLPITSTGNGDPENDDLAKDGNWNSDSDEEFAMHACLRGFIKSKSIPSIQKHHYAEEEIFDDNVLANATDSKYLTNGLISAETVSDEETSASSAPYFSRSRAYYNHQIPIFKTKSNISINDNWSIAANNFKYGMDFESDDDLDQARSSPFTCCWSAPEFVADNEQRTSEELSTSEEAYFVQGNARNEKSERDDLSGYDEPIRTSILDFDAHASEQTNNLANFNSLTNATCPRAISENDSLCIYNASPSPTREDEKISFVDELPETEEAINKWTPEALINFAKERFGKNSKTENQHSPGNNDVVQRSVNISKSLGSLDLWETEMGWITRVPSPMNAEMAMHQSISCHDRMITSYVDCAIQNHYNRCSSPGCRKYASKPKEVIKRENDMDSGSDTSDDEWIRCADDMTLGDAHGSNDEIYAQVILPSFSSSNDKGTDKLFIPTDQQHINDMQMNNGSKEIVDGDKEEMMKCENTKAFSTALKTIIDDADMIRMRNGVVNRNNDKYLSYQERNQYSIFIDVLPRRSHSLNSLHQISDGLIDFEKEKYFFNTKMIANNTDGEHHYADFHDLSNFKQHKICYPNIDDKNDVKYESGKSVGNDDDDNDNANDDNNDNDDIFAEVILPVKGNELSNFYGFTFDVKNSFRSNTTKLSPSIVESETLYPFADERCKTGNDNEAVDESQSVVTLWDNCCEYAQQINEIARIWFQKAPETSNISEIITDQRALAVYPKSGDLTKFTMEGMELDNRHLPVLSSFNSLQPSTNVLGLTGGFHTHSLSSTVSVHRRLPPLPTTVIAATTTTTTTDNNISNDNNSTDNTTTVINYTTTAVTSASLSDQFNLTTSSMSTNLFSPTTIVARPVQSVAKEDHRICFGTDSVMDRSALFSEDGYYEDNNLNDNQLSSRKVALAFGQDDSSGVSSCCTGLEQFNPTHRVHSSFVPRHDDEVLLEIGDAVHVERECEDHWCYGINLRTNQPGIFPSAHVCEIDLVEEICMGALPSNVNQTTMNERDTFYLTMLASIEVAHHKGNDVLVQAMNKVLSVYQNREEIIVPQTVLMEVSFRGIHIIDKRRKNFFQCPTFDFFYSLQNISFCGAHPKQLRYFGFITKHPLLPRFACHVFLSNVSTQPIVESIGRAFKRSYDEYMAFAHPTEDIYLE